MITIELETEQIDNGVQVMSRGNEARFNGLRAHLSDYDIIKAPELIYVKIELIIRRSELEVSNQKLLERKVELDL